MTKDNKSQFYLEHYDSNVFSKKDLIKAYYHTYRNYGKIEMHSHNFNELNIVIKGSGTHFIGEKNFEIQKGAIFIIPPNIKHGYEFIDNSYKVFHILFKEDFFTKYDELLKEIHGYRVFFHIEPDIRINPKFTNSLFDFGAEKSSSFLKQLDELVKISDSDKKNSQQKEEFLTLYLISAICENIKESQSAIIADENLLAVIKAIEYLQKHYNEKITLKMLCDRATMSRSSFLRHFKTLYNKSPFEYLNDYRIRQSKKFLQNSEKTIATIAQECGFFDSSHFIKLFLKSEGIPPQKYRASRK